MNLQKNVSCHVISLIRRWSINKQPREESLIRESCPDWVFVGVSSYKQYSNMQEKILLINSMQKLINHIVLSKKNQQEIFASLSKNDFKKIISNLEDDHQKLRKISLLLISQLLHNNHALKQKFCNIMNIPILPGRVALNTKLCPSSSRNKNTVTVDMAKNIKEVYALLKQPISDNEKQSLFWHINFDHKPPTPLQLEYLTTPHPQAVQVQDLLDPIDSMIGFVLTEKESAKKTPEYTPLATNETRRKSEYDPNNSTRLVNNYFKPAPYRPDSFKLTSPSAALNQSLNLNPGYSTDRQPTFIPKTINSGIKPINSSMYQQSPLNQFNKSTQSTISPPLHQLKSNNETEAQRPKYAGIKVVSNTNSSVKYREGKYFEENPLLSGQIGTGSKVVSFNGGSTIAPKPNITNRVERGYQTLRQKKIIEKYAAE